MQLLGKLIIKSKERIIQFLNNENTGRISSIDKDGFPQIIPMNFVFLNNAVYMHSHIKGEKMKEQSKIYINEATAIGFRQIASMFETLKF